MTKFVVVGWPEIQSLMELEGFEENAYLILDDKGMEDFGSSAYFVNEDWLNEVEGETQSGEKTA